MQTQINPFDFLAQGSSVDGLKPAAKTSDQGTKQASGAMDAFMEIMSALLALPTDQTQISPGGSETQPAEDESAPAGIFEDDSADPEALLDQDWKDLELPELLQMLFGSNVPVELENQGGQFEQNREALKQMVLSFLETQLPPVLQAQQDPTEVLKDRWLQFYNQLGASGQEGETDPAAGQVAAPSIAAAQGQLENTQLLRGWGHKPAGNAMDDAKLQIESIPDTESDVDGKVIQKTAAFIRGSDTDAIAQDHPAMRQGQLSAKPVLPQGFTNPITVANQQSAAESKLPTDAGGNATGAQNPELNPEIPTISDGDDSAGDPLMRSSTTENVHQGPLSRLDIRTDQSVSHISGGKEMMPLEKETQTDVIRQIVQRMSLHTQTGQSKMTIQLKPEFLGNVHMQVLTENHQVSVRMLTDSLAVKEVIEQNIQHLRLELQHHGLEIQKFDVLVGNDSQGWHSGQQEAGFKQALRQRQQRLSGNKTAFQKADDISAAEPQRQNRYVDPGEIDYFA